MLILNIFKNLFVMGLLTDLQRQKKLFKASTKHRNATFLFLRIVIDANPCPQGMGERVCAELQQPPPQV